MNLSERNDEWRALVEVFSTESVEMLDEVEPRLVELEKRHDPGLINSIFRLFHSLKGGAASLGLLIIRDLTHEAETLLDVFRGNLIKKSILSSHIDLMCQTCDLSRKIISQLQIGYDDSEFKSEATALRLELVQSVMDLMDDFPPNFEVFPGAHGSSLASNPKSRADIESSEVQVESASGCKLAGTIGELKLDLTPEMSAGFAAEAEELFEAVETNLVALEKDPTDTGPLAEAFRAFHSLKGNCGFFGFVDMERLSHQTENLLGAMRDGLVSPDRPSVSLVLSSLDALKGGIKSLKSGASPALPKSDGLIEQLHRASVHAASPKPPESHISTEKAATQTLRKASPEQDKTEPVAMPKSPEEAAKPVSTSGKQTIRVDTEKLDRLIELVGELVISEANLANCAELRNLKVERIEKSIDQLNKISKDLQNIAMSVRMIPVSGLFRKMIRPVRDLARAFGKQIDLQFRGEETEVDKNVIELISDPLMHLIRNSADHGIESPEERKANGKSEVGVIVLEARHSGGEVWIIVRDDGQGLNRKRILAKARQSGLCASDGSDLRDEEVHKFIFSPGFSTVEQVSEVSGRGVGMDVVKRNIEKLKGRVEVSSFPGKGAAFTIRIAITFAIIEGMVVQVGSERYILPMQSIIEFVRPTHNLLSTVVKKGEVINIRGQLIPLLRLSTVFGIRNAQTDPTQAHAMIVEHEDKRYGLMVDQILGQQQTVVKSLGATLGNMRGISGAAVMPDGRVGLILDLGGLIPLLLDSPI